MSLQVENLEHNMAKVTIEVEAAKLDDAIKQAVSYTHLTLPTIA